MFKHILISNDASKRIRRSLGGMLSPDIVFFSLMLLGCNLHLLMPGLIHPPIFDLNAFISGKWWLVVSYPFVHASWYHFLLDVGAFFLLYTGLETQRISERLLYTAGCGLCSFIASVLFAPELQRLGLGGISGVAHGLVAVAALEMIASGKYTQQGWVCLIIVVFKSLYEIIAGKMLFSFLLFGMCGTPLVAAHIGGVVGGVAAFVFLNRFKPTLRQRLAAQP